MLFVLPKKWGGNLGGYDLLVLISRAFQQCIQITAVLQYLLTVKQIIWTYYYAFNQKSTKPEISPLIPVENSTIVTRTFLRCKDIAWGSTHLSRATPRTRVCSLKDNERIGLWTVRGRRTWIVCHCAAVILCFELIRSV